MGGIELSNMSSELIRAARALLRWDQRQLADSSSVSLPTVKRLEAKPGSLAAHGSTVAALRRALEDAGVEFTNGDQPGVRLRKASREFFSRITITLSNAGHTSFPIRAFVIRTVDFALAE